MTRSKQLADEFREVILNGKWIARTNLKEQISGLDWIKATKKIDNLNTIAALTFHIGYYIGGVLDVFNGGPLVIRDKFSFDAPNISSQAEWNQLKRQLFDNSEAFAGAVEKMSDKQLSSDFVKSDYGTYERNIRGMIEHCYYHFGQIVLLRKMVDSK